MMKKHNRFSLVAGLVLLAIPLALAAATFTWQGRVQTSAGVDLQGLTPMGFRIYNAGGSLLWGETQAVPIDRGIASVELGRVNALPDSLLLDPGLSLGITLPGEAEMAPREPLVSTWKALSSSRVSGQAVQAGGGTLLVSGAAEAGVPITFPTAFASPPVVSIGAPEDAVGGEYFIVTRVSDVTATGCTVHFASLSGAAASGATSFDWIAIGE